MSAGANTFSASIFVNPHFKEQEYKPKYCMLNDFEDYYQHEITEDTVPNVIQAIKLIQVAEAEIDSKEWGTYTQTDEYLDGNFEILTFQWQYVGFFAQIFYPHHTNIIRIIKCHYNSGGVPSADPFWFEIKEGPAAGSSFVILRKPKLKEQIGGSILLYSNVPYPGPLRLRVTYEYGMNIDSALLREYAGKKAAMDALELRAAAENININLSEGPYSALYKNYTSRLRFMREELFPKKTRKVWVYPSVR